MHTDKKPQMSTDTGGMTLVEVLVSVLIFAFVIISVIGLFVQTVRISKKLNYDYTAFNLARNRIERLRAIDYDMLSSAVETDTHLNPDGTVDPYGEFRRTTLVTTNYLGNSRLTSIEVEVTYIFLGKETTTPLGVTTLFVDM